MHFEKKKFITITIYLFVMQFIFYVGGFYKPVIKFTKWMANLPIINLVTYSLWKKLT